MYDQICSAVDYGGLTLKNRIVFAPASMGLHRAELLARIETLAAGGCSMIILGDVPVLPQHFGMSLFSQQGFALYRQLADIVHRYDCKLCAQLHQTDTDFKGMLRYLPGLLTGRISRDRLRALLQEHVGPYITALPEKRVRQITAAFGPAAERAVEAGFDMVQVHGDRMCGSFSSVVFNHRTDAYGGSAANRARFGVEAVAAIRKRLPHLPIDYKLAVRQEDPPYGNAGVAESELSVFVPLLEQAGVTSFHVALANHGNLCDTIPPKNHPVFGAEGCFLPLCDRVRALTRCPVCAVGGLTDPDFIEAQLRAGRMDCVAMCRQLIADPAWPRKVAAGHPGEIRRCLRCNQKCLGGMMSHQGVHCIWERKD